MIQQCKIPSLKAVLSAGGACLERTEAETSGRILYHNCERIEQFMKGVKIWEQYRK